MQSTPETGKIVLIWNIRQFSLSDQLAISICIDDVPPKGKQMDAFGIYVKLYIMRIMQSIFLCKVTL